MAEYKLKPFVDKYKTVIFDMDGVISSEQMYWNCAALTVYELLNDKDYYGNQAIDRQWCIDNVKALREKIFCNDTTIKLAKNIGVNSNWDLAYIVVCMAMILHTKDDFDKVYDYTKTFDCNALEMYDILAELLSKKTSMPLEDCLRTGSLWKNVQVSFQDWYWGKGKTQGLCYNEQPLIDAEKLIIIMKLLYEKGITPCIGTGRPKREIIHPMTKWGIGKYMPENRRINYNHVLDAEAEFEKNGIDVALTKPHPFMFLKAMLGEEYPNDKILNGDYDKSLVKTTLVVGDAGADILASQAMGADFLAVLTGISGVEAKGYFEEQKAQYILDSLEQILEEE